MSSLARCGCPRRRRSDGPSTCSTPTHAGPSPIGSLPRRLRVSRPSGLGRGLSALIPTQLIDDPARELRELPISAVEPNRFQPRSHFEEDSLLALADSIREIGVLQPVLVRPIPPA